MDKTASQVQKLRLAGSRDAKTGTFGKPVAPGMRTVVKGGWDYNEIPSRTGSGHQKVIKSTPSR